MSNKKIKNATVVKDGVITFKSKLEKSIFDTLLQHGFNPQYEPKTFVLIPSFTASTPFYDKETDRQLKKRREEGDKTARMLVKKNPSIQSIKYTPDFYFKYNNLNVYIEGKGLENDVFYIKKKLFIRLLDTFEEPSIYFEVYTKKQLLQAIDIIKSYEQTDRTNEEVSETTSKE